MEASIKEKGQAVEIGTPQELFRLAVTSGTRLYAVSPDGKRFLVAEVPQSQQQPLTLVTNWTASLEK